MFCLQPHWHQRQWEKGKDLTLGCPVTDTELTLVSAQRVAEALCSVVLKGPHLLFQPDNSPCFVLQALVKHLQRPIETPGATLADFCSPSWSCFVLPCLSLQLWWCCRVSVPTQERPFQGYREVRPQCLPTAWQETHGAPSSSTTTSFLECVEWKNNSTHIQCKKWNVGKEARATANIFVFHMISAKMQLS